MSAFTGRPLRQLAYLLALQQLPQPLPATTNMVLNPNFEATKADGSTPLHWGLPAIFARSTAVTLPPATASLEYRNTDPKLYELASQKIVGAVVGREYRFSAAIKTTAFNTTAGPGDATVCVQWDDLKGKWLGGQFPHGPSGANAAWTTVGGSFNLPVGADPASVQISVYVRPISTGEPTPTGTAYFDNVSLWYAPKPPLTSVLLAPLYRGRVTAADPTPISLRARVRLETPQTVALVAILAPKQVPGGGEAAKQVIARKDVGPFVLTGQHPALRVDIVFDEIDAHKALEPGEYTAELTLVKISAGGKNQTLGTSTQSITRMDDTAPPPTVFIDRQKRTIVDGDPFFPIGFYFSTTMVKTGSPALANLSGTPFNFIMPYGEPSLANMDAAAAVGLKVGFSLKDIFFGTQRCPKDITSRAVEEKYFKQRVSDFRNHSALLAWCAYIHSCNEAAVLSPPPMSTLSCLCQSADDSLRCTCRVTDINDELTPAYLPQLKAHQQWLIGGDPDHPSWQVLCEDGEFDDCESPDPDPAAAAASRSVVTCQLVLHTQA